MEVHDLHISVQCTAVRVLTCTVQQVYSGSCADMHSATSVQRSVC